MASFSVVSNIASANAQANLGTTQIGLQRALNRLSSGFRINTAGDDAAGLAVANGYRNTIAVMSQGIRNANDGLSKLQVYDGAMSTISTLLDRLATLATQASSTDPADTASFDVLDDEFQDIIAEIDRESAIAGLDADVTFSVYMYDDATNGEVTGTISAVTTAAGSSLDLGAEDLTDATNARAALSKVTAAVTSLGGIQGKVGALMNRLQFAVTLAQTQVVNTKAAESRIRDANVAEESANMTRFNILSQSGIAALAQANQSSASVLALLR